MRSFLPRQVGFVPCIEGSFEVRGGPVAAGVEFRISWGKEWASLFVRLHAEITVRFSILGKKITKTFRLQHSFLVFLSVENERMVYQASALSGDPYCELQLSSFYDPVMQEVVLVCDNGAADWTAHVIPAKASLPEVISA